MMDSLSAQTEQASYKLITDKLESSYNQSKYDTIFDMFSAAMQAALPLEKTRDFFTGLKNQAGLIKEREFVTYVKTVAVYKTTFEKIVFAVNISLDSNSKINGLLIKPFKPGNLPKIERNTTKLILPFHGTWHVVWGGDTKELNYHIENEAQKNAFDILIVDKTGKSYHGNGKTNEDFYAFGKELIAPCDGEIVWVINGVADNIPGEMNTKDITGNTVVIKTIHNEFLYFCHFKNQTIQVKEGDKVKQGQLLGLCGNSGHSSEPHLHFHIQNVKDMNIATGVKCYFNKIAVNGILKTDYSPVQNDNIENVKN